jgi:lysophospholipase L1-like esterase
MNTTTKKAANSIVGKITAGILATAAVAAAPAHAGVLVVGDSLEVGSGPYLRAAVPGIRVDAVKGRSSTQGVQVLAARLSPADSVVVFPLGTNDSPSSPAVLAADLSEAARLAGDRCMVVATIVRPLDVSALNRVVLAFAARTGAQVVDWRGAVRAFPTLVGADGVHSNASGYALRASLIAEAIDACRSGGAGAGASGIPAPRNPNARPPARAPATSALRTPPALAAVGFVLTRAAATVVGAVRAAQTAASKAGPEPVLGAP